MIRTDLVIPVLLAGWTGLVLFAAIFFPGGGLLPKTIVSQSFLVGGALIGLIVILVTSLFKRDIQFAHSHLFQLLVALGVALIVGAVFSVSAHQSVWGLVFETGTIAFWGALIGWFAVGYVLTRGFSHHVLLLSLAMLTVLINVVLVVSIFLPSTVLMLPEVSVLGFLNGLLLVISSVFFIKKERRSLSILYSFFIVLGVIATIIVGSKLLLLVIAIALIGLFATFLYLQESGWRLYTIGALGLLLLICSFLPINPDWYPGTTTIRPGIAPTIAIAQETLKTDLSTALFGSGPNTFEYAWNLHKPVSINQTPFWNIDFHTGSNFFSTILVTGGAITTFLWVVLVLYPLWGGLRTLLFHKSGSAPTIIIVGASLFTFLWLFIDVPNGVLLTVIALFLGFVASVSDRDSSHTFFASRKRLRVGMILLFLSISMFSLFEVTQKAYAAAVFERGAVQFSQGGSVEAAITSTEAAIARTEHPLFYRFLAELTRIELDRLLQEGVETRQEVDDFGVYTRNILQYAEQATSNDPNNYLYHVTLGNMYTQLVVIGRREYVEQAANAYQTARELSPQNPIPVYLFARLLLSQGQFLGAEQAASEALKLKPDYAPALEILYE